MYTIAELRAAYISGEKRPSDVIKEVFAVIEEKNDDIFAFLDVFDDAFAIAELADAAYEKNGADTPPLLGIPVAMKTNILIKDKRATASSKILENYTATYDATIARRLRDAGAIFVGTTNMDEFAMGSSTESSAFGITKNPLDTSRVPGGSSGGSAAAVAMGAVPVAIGTDTGGSIRQPAVYCGLVGYKPTYGAVSRYGLIALASSLDQAGPFTNTVADAELVHNTMAGQDEMDGTTISDDTYPAVSVKETYTIGVPRDFFTEGVDEDVLKAFDAHIEELKTLGHTVVDISLPLFEKGLAAYYIVMPAEASSNLARYDGIRYGYSAPADSLLEVYEKSRAQGFGDEVKRRILLGTHVLSAGYYDAYYGKAELARKKMREELDAVFKSVDLIVTPTTPTPAFKFGENTDPLAMYRQDIFTVPVNLTGVPAITLPVATVERDGTALPIGVQYIAPHAGDARLFALGKKLYDERR